MLEKRDNSVEWFFDRADVLMVALGSDESIVKINEKASQILGCSNAEVASKNWFDTFVPEKKRENARRFFHEMLQSSLRHVHSEYPITPRYGKEFIFSFHNVLISDEKGRTLGTFISGEDVTERRQKEQVAKEVETRLQVSLDFMIEGCQIIDADWRYVYVNQAAARQGRMRKEQLLGYPMMQVYPGIDQTEMFSNLRNCMMNRVPHQMENEFTYPDGSKAWFELRMEPVPEGVLILSMDITRTKADEAELSSYRSRLEQVVAQRTAECAETNEQLERKIQQAQKTEEQLALRATILDNAQEAIFLVNSKGDFVYANVAALEMYYYNLDELLNMNIRMLLQPKDTASSEGLLRHIAEKGQTSLEMVHSKKDGTAMPVKLYSNIVKTPHGQFIVLVIRRLFRR